MRSLPLQRVGGLLLLCVLAAVAAFLGYEVYVHANDEPVTYVASEYIRCIGLLDDTDIGNCLDDLAQYAYDHYSIRDIGVQIDGLTYQQKNRWCHEVMHYLGWKAYKEDGSVADAFLEALPLCDSGMYHGVMEQYLRENGMSGNVGELIKSICVDSLAENPDFSEGTKALCYHGLGHGLMYVTTSDLGKSLDFCDLLEDKAIGECYTGVFMEYKTSKAIGELDNDRNLDDFSQCLPLTDHQKASCFNTQGLNYLSLAYGDVKRAVEYCGKVPQEYLYNCYVGVGANTPSPSRSHADAAMACKPAREVAEAAYEGCIQGAISFVLQLDRGEPSGANEFCMITDEDKRGYCYHKMGNALQAWVGLHDTFESKCAIVTDPAYNHECILGLQGRDQV